MEPESIWKAARRVYDIKNEWQRMYKVIYENVIYLLHSCFRALALSTAINSRTKSGKCSKPGQAALFQCLHAKLSFEAPRHTKHHIYKQR